MRSSVLTSALLVISPALLASACSSALELGAPRDMATDAGAAVAPAQDASQPEPPASRFPHVSPELSPGHGYRPLRFPDTGDGVAMAYDGEQYLLAFGDPDSDITNRRLIRVVRVSADGEILDPGGIAITPTLRGLGSPLRVAAGRRHFVVAWQEWLADGGFRVRYARVRSFDGEVLDPAGVDVEMPEVFGTVDLTDPQVAYVDGTFVVGYLARGRAVFLPIDEASGVAGGPLRSVPADGFRLCAGQDRMLVLTSSAERISAHLLPYDATAGLNERFGRDLPAAKLLAEHAPNPWSLAAAYREGSFLTAWGERDDDGWRLVARHVDEMTGSTGDAFLSMAETDRRWAPGPGRVELAASGGGFVAVTNAGLALHASHIDPRGEATPLPVIVEDTSGPGETASERPGSFALASDGHRFHVAWHNDTASSGSPGGVHRAWLPAVGDMAAPTRADPLWGPANQTRGAIAQNGELAVVVWREHRGKETPSQALMAARVRLSDGAVLDEQPIELFGVPCSDFSGCGFLGFVDITSNGDGFLVTFTWTSGLVWHNQVLALRLDASGAPIDDRPLPLLREPQGTTPRVASNGDDYLVVYRSFRWPGYSGPGYEVDHAIEAVRVPSSGPPATDARLTVVPPDAEASAFPDVVFDGIDYVVVWQVCPGGGGGCWAGPGELRVARLSDADGVLTSSPSRVLAEPAPVGSKPRIAHDRGHLLVVYEDRQNQAETGTDIRGAILRAGTLVPEAVDVPLATTPLEETHATVVGDGFGFLLAWSHDGDLRVSRVELDALPEAAEPVVRGIELSSDAGEPELASFAPGEFLSVYHRLDPRSGRTQIRSRFVIYDPETGPF